MMAVQIRHAMRRGLVVVVGSQESGRVVVRDSVKVDPGFGGEPLQASLYPGICAD